MKLNSLLISLLSVAFATASFAGTSSGKACTTCAPTVEEKTLGVVTIGYDTNYVYRGINIATNLVSANLDVPISLDAISKDLSLVLTSWYGASDDAVAAFGGGDYQELDLVAVLQKKFGAVTAGLKYEHYFFFADASSIKDINELGVTLSASVKGLDLTAYVGYDFTAQGWYYEGAVSHTFKINDKISLVPGVLISFGSDYYGVNGGNTIKPSLAMPIKLAKSATLTPYIAGNLPYGSLNSLGEQDRVYGGVALTVTF
ncbi:MAG: hypothetical protein K8R87_09270 [Verrucomicrobia bacterium]|nr:hypothetical protein [Verrucomicrobiota bacterium]